jgi:hypothetical protein
MAKKRQGNLYHTIKKESNIYIPEIIVAVLLGIIVFFIILIIIN